MLIEYKISRHEGVVTVTQRIEPDNNPVKPAASSLAATESPAPGVSLGTGVVETPPPKQKGMAIEEKGGGPGDKGDTGGGPPGGSAGSGLVIAFGPVVFLDAGLITSGDTGGGPGDKTGTEGLTTP